ncbi:MAG TPA: hypothetical protein VFY93_12740 [Planctomycetota bacterium]|nr:hypothetical protein [Planctomycetota bacterium]
MLRDFVLPLAATLGILAGCAATPEQGAASYEPQSMNVLLGGSFDRAGDGVALGANYEYRVSHHLGAGAFADVAFARDASTVLGGGIFVHPADRWTLLAGPGVEFADGDADVIGRVGGWYAIPVDRYRLAPTAWVDIGGDTAFFIGLSFGFDL